MISFDLLRGLHIISVIAWMAGIMYLPRLFVHHLKNWDEPKIIAVFIPMERNLLRIIMNPAMILTWLFGAGLAYFHVTEREGWKFFLEPWFLTKEAGIVFITGWHHYLAIVQKRLDKGQKVGSEKYWRMVNELPFLAAIIMVIAVTTEFWAN